MRRKKSKASAETSGIVTSDAVQRKNHTLRSSRLLWVLLAAAVIVVLGILGYAAWRTNRTATPAPAHQSSKSTSIHMPQDNLKNAQNALTGAQSTEDKISAYLSLGGAYMGTNQLSQAIVAYKQADTLSDGQNLVALVQLCNLYNMTKQHNELVGVLQQTIAYYKKQVAADSTDYKAAGQLAWYQTALARVQGGGQL